MAGYVLTEAALVALFVLWVTVYSHLWNPGHSQAVYERYAQTTGPYFGTLASIPAFFWACRWMARRVARPFVPALVFFSLSLAVEVSSAWAAPPQTMPVWFLAVNLGLKLASCLAGAASGRTPQSRPAA